MEYQSVAINKQVIHWKDPKKLMGPSIAQIKCLPFTRQRKVKKVVFADVVCNVRFHGGSLDEVLIENLEEITADSLRVAQSRGLSLNMQGALTAAINLFDMHGLGVIPTH